MNSSKGVQLDTLWSMKPYGQYCPVAQALELIGDRWTLLVVRELLSGSVRFGDILRGVPRMPRSMLARRLMQLENDGMLRRRPGKAGSEYVLTDSGAALEDVIVALGSWSRRFAYRQLKDEEIDAGLLMWNIQRGIDPGKAPQELVLVRLDFQDPRIGVERYWLKIHAGEGELCLSNPGLQETLVVQTNARVLTEIWLGQRDFRKAITSREVVIDGPKKLASEFPSWFLLNHFVQLERGHVP